jgi:hypothetical protein
MIARILSCIFLMILTLSLAACGGGPQAATILKGEVSFEGQPLPLGTIDFYDGSGKKLGSTSISAGKYMIENLPVGEGKVAFTTPPPVESAPGPDPKVLAGPQQKVVSIPPTFADPNQSGQTWKIEKRGTHTINFTLK